MPAPARDRDPAPAAPLAPGNLTLFADLYQLTMMYGYLQAGKADTLACFDLYFRRNPFGNGFAIMAGLESVLSYIEHLQFTADDEAFLRSSGLFPDERFFEALKSLRFTGTMYAMPEGTIAFPNEPLVRVEARLFEAQLLETALLALIGHQTLIATKADRVVRAAQGRPVFEFGARRAHGPEAALYGARAAIIGGCVGTSNVQAAKRFGIPITGTQGHSWVASFESELAAFRAYAAVYPDNLVLIVDTVDVLRSGLPNAITVFHEVHARHGKPQLFGIRLDSGDLAYLSREARRVLDQSGFPDAKILASNDLDEEIIASLHAQGARIDGYGVGTKLLTAFDQPALGCIYKLAAIADHRGWSPRIKVSENPEKVTTPGVKRVMRLFTPESGDASVDFVMFADEHLPAEPFVVSDPLHTWKRKLAYPENAQELLVPVFVDGRCVYDPPSLPNIAASTQRNLKTIPEETKRLLNPHVHHVDLSQRLWEAKQALLQHVRAEMGKVDAVPTG